MKIKANILHDFVRKTSINGLIEGALYSTTEDGLRTISRDQTSFVIADGLLRKGSFTALEETKLPIRNNKLFMDCLAQYGTMEVDVTLQENNVLITGKVNNRTVNSSLKAVNEELLDTKMDAMPEKLVFDAKPFKIDGSMFSMAKRHSDVLKQKTLQFSSTGGKLIVTVGDKEFDQFSQECAVEADDFKVKFGETFFQVSDILGSNVQMIAKSDYPALLKESNEAYELSIVIAPIVEEDKDNAAEDTKEETTEETTEE